MEIINDIPGSRSVSVSSALFSEFSAKSRTCKTTAGEAIWISRKVREHRKNERNCFSLPVALISCIESTPRLVCLGYQYNNRTEKDTNNSGNDDKTHVA